MNNYPVAGDSKNVQIHKMETIKEISFSTEAVNLIRRCGLPVSDLSDDERFRYFTAGSSDNPDGVIVLETLGQHGLLRSLSVEPGCRGKGVGEALVTVLEQHAARLGLQRLYLLTTDATVYFEKRNYSVADRKSAPEEIRQSTQFKDLCPSGSVLMMKLLLKTGT